MSNGAAGDFLTTPELVKCPIAVGMIACGANHNLVLSDDRTEVRPLSQEVLYCTVMYIIL